MKSTDDIVKFCPKRQAFIFENEDTAAGFIVRFGDLLLLDPVMTINDQGEFLVSPEPLTEPFDGD